MPRGLIAPTGEVAQSPFKYQRSRKNDHVLPKRKLPHSPPPKEGYRAPAKLNEGKENESVHDSLTIRRQTDRRDYRRYDEQDEHVPRERSLIADVLVDRRRR